MEHRLQPLRIPTGWTVEYNGLYEMDPPDVAEDDWDTFLSEDLLQMKQEHFNRLLDVGWYRSGNPVDGAYGLVVYEGDFRGKLLFELRTADRAQLVSEIERLLEKVCDARL